MAELPIIQTFEKMRVHPELDDILDASEWLRAAVESGTLDSHPYLTRRGLDPTGRYSALWEVPGDIRQRDAGTDELLRPGELHIQKFAVHFGTSALTLSIRHQPEQPPMISVGPRRLITYPQVSFTIGYNPNPEQFPFSKEWSPHTSDEERGPLPARKEIYMSFNALSNIGQPNADVERPTGIKEFSEMFFRIPAQLGIYHIAQRRRDYRESSEAVAASAS